MKFKEMFLEASKKGQKFHPIDVFQERWVVTDGDVILGSNGEIKDLAQYKKDMKNIKRYDQYDDIYFPTEKMAKKFLNTLADPDEFYVEKLSYY